MGSLPDAGLDAPPASPLELFERWYTHARDHERHELTAMTLATSGADGRTSARIVLLKQHGIEGFTFYTNYGSRKSAHLDANPNAALLFWFPVLQRQIRIEGRVTRVPAAESEAYFAGRPRGSQLGAWASTQSRPLDGRATLEQALADTEARFAGRKVTRPPHWGGWRLMPDWIEFWHEGAARLHDRIVYQREGSAWQVGRLYP